MAQSDMRFLKASWVIGALLLGSCCAEASLTITPWIPIFKGIERAVGTNCPNTVVTNNGVAITDSTLQVVNCLKIDLTDPDVQLFTTPRAPGWVAESRETLSLSISNFIRNYKVQVASDANFYCVSQGFCTPDPSAEGLPSEVHGFLVCTGQVVSPVDNQGRYASLLFTTNKEPSFKLNNSPPGSNLTNVYTAVTGYYPLLTNGVNVWALYFNDFNNQYPDATIHGPQPRTAFGISQDRRYLFMMTIDGRQPSSGGGTCGSGYSNGAVDAETAMWLLLFGAWDAISMDGGGSTALYMADCAGEPIGLNHSSLLAGRNAERIIGCHFGVYAKPLPSGLDPIEVLPGETTATIKWHTPVAADSQIDYGPTASLDFVTVDPGFSRNHVLTLSDLTANTRYYFQITSRGESDTFHYACQFRTTNAASIASIYGITKSWKYTTNNQDGTTWKLRTFDDTAWLGPGPGLLFVENNVAISPKSTPLPYSANSSGSPVSGIPVSPTYYFRTHFNFSGPANGVTLYFTNYLDDAAVFYLNGTEIQRIRMTPAPATISYTAIADPPNIGPCGTGNEATCPDVFTVSGNGITNLLAGDNVVAVELHQAASTSNDAVFGSALSYSTPAVTRPVLNILLEGTTSTLYWNGSGFTLQQATDPAGPWTDVPGPVTTSTFQLTDAIGTYFYRLRN